MREKLSNLYAKDGTKAVLSSLISIVIGLVVGSIIILLVGIHVNLTHLQAYLLSLVIGMVDDF